MAAAVNILDLPFRGGLPWCLLECPGFFSVRVHRHSAKRHHARRLLNNREFLALRETHETNGSQAAFSDFEGTRSFWSAGTSARSGVGLLVKTGFLQLFPVQQWDEGP